MPHTRADARRNHPRHQRRGPARRRRDAGGQRAYLLLPEQLLIAPRYVPPALEVALLAPLVAINPRCLTRQTRTFLP
ncbi:hypothetical protein [Streptomyces sp. NPDC021622]|uniref:hypothetical protein n=1 Tax=Streptomyces sp. NPDC021622 TaxID=3155013 RepID=UPI0033DCE252